MMVIDQLEKLGLHYRTVELGEVDIIEDLSIPQRDQFRSALLSAGLELLDDKKSVLIQKVKTCIIELVHYSEEPLTINLSEYLSRKLDYDYTYLANLFSEVLGTTIEKFFILHKIERVKEWLVYNELTLTEIARKMHYSSVSYLSNQFRKVTGLTPTHFKQLKDKKRSMLEEL